nr:MAG TPA: hypothetical protein [Caudoviricetes sp.]
MKFPKIVIISNGKNAAAMVDGIVYGRGVGKIRFKSDGATSTLDIADIDGSSYKGGDEADFLKAWERFSNDTESFKLELNLDARKILADVLQEMRDKHEED